MTKKRNAFDIDFTLDDDAEDSTDREDGFPVGNQRAPETKARNVQGHPLQNDGAVPERRGPMASAISETLDANQERASAEARIRAENDALAHEHVRLKKLGLITDLIPTDAVKTSKLIRDRAAGADAELDELMISIQSVGLSNPIRVEQTPDGYELIQGYRRLHAFRRLAEETSDPRYRKIPAALVPRGEPLSALYRKMVDENLVRKDISFGEMALLAINYAHDAGLDLDDAVGKLYGSALKQKRRYIRQFAQVFAALNGAVQYPEVVPRALGIDLHKAFEDRADKIPALIEALQALDPKMATSEVEVLKAFVADKPKPVRTKKLKGDAKTSLRLPRPEGDARIVAADGRVELRLDRDFSTVPRAVLQDAIEQFLSRIDGD